MLRCGHSSVRLIPALPRIYCAQPLPYLHTHTCSAFIAEFLPELQAALKAKPEVKFAYVKTYFVFSNIINQLTWGLPPMFVWVKYIDLVALTAHPYFENGATSGFEMCLLLSDPSTMGAGGPNTNTSRIHL